MLRQTELKRFDVVAGILLDGDGRVLITERVGDGPFHGLWEFPGGKINGDESLEAALRRELSEELGVDTIASAHFMKLDHTYPDRHVSIDFYLVTEWMNEPAALEGQRMRWVSIGELDADILLPADLPVVEALKAV
ncbi:MAG: 8-oxo-dGTP diphosphatase MutT [Woeseiaceae bacterium]|nr:8-oxo-dGTP diphosphatase MutT [Woeseiaceae bacterium]